MKALLILLLISFHALSAEWKTVYANLENRSERMSFEDYAEACSQGVSDACKDAWVDKVIPEVRATTNEYEPTQSKLYYTKLRESCERGQHFLCEGGMSVMWSNYNYSLGALEDYKNKMEEKRKMIEALGDKVGESDSADFKRAEEDYNGLAQTLKPFQDFFAETGKPNCARVFDSGVRTELCESFLGEAFFKEKTEEYVTTCTASKDNDLCSQQREKLKVYSQENSYVEKICADKAFYDLSVCERYKAMELAAQAERERGEAQTRNMLLGLGAFIGLVFVLWLYSTRCPSCKKFRSYYVLKKEHLGTDFEGQETEEVKTGEIRSADNNVIATIHGKKKVNVFKKKFLVTRQCNKCGYTSQSRDSEKIKQDA